MFLDPPKTHKQFWGESSMTHSTHTVVHISWNLALSVLQFWGGIKKFLDPQNTLIIFEGV